MGRTTIMIVNDVFDGENMMIIKSKGSEQIIRSSQIFEISDLQKYVKDKGLSNDAYDLIVAEKSWKGEITCKEY